MMTKKVVHKEVFNNRYEKNYLDHILEHTLKLRPFHVWVVDAVETEYLTEEEALAAAGIKYPDCEGYMLKGKINIKTKVCRYTYPRWDEVMKDGKRESQRFEISDNGRPYVFNRSDFVREDEVVDVGPENQMLVATLNGHTYLKEEDNSLPFPPMK
ncbi:MAG: hypothetical protein H0W84_10850 [Bacteroidetes bacterium]|nr:hypothetical protein [Bacteroidota bacterium]